MLNSVILNLKRQFNFTEIIESKVEIKKSDGTTDLSLFDLVEGKIRINIKVAFGQTEFVGSKTIKVYWTEQTNEVRRG